MISEIEIRLRADIARLQQDMDKARQAVGGGLDKINKAVGETVGLLGGLAVGAAAVNFGRFIKSSIDAADALNDLSDRTAVAIEDLAGLDFAARMTGSTLDGVAGAVSKLSLNIGKDSEKFRELGVTATEPLEALKQLADVFKTIQDPQQRAAFGAEALGKSWAEVAPLLNEGSAGIDKLVGRGKELSGVTEEVARDAATFNDKLDELTFAARGFGTQLAADLLPLMNELLAGVNATGNAAGKAADEFNPLTETMRALVVLGGNVAFTFKAVGTEIGAVTAQVVQFAGAAGKFLSLDWKGGMEQVRDALRIGDMAKEDAAKAREAFDEWEKRILQAGKVAKQVQEDAGITQFMQDVDSALAGGAKAAQVAAFLKAEEVAAARKKAADEAAKAAEKENEAYRSTVAAINEKITANKAEVASAAPLLESQKMRIKLDQDLKSGKLVLTKAHENEVRAALASLESHERLAAAEKATTEAQAALQKERAAAVLSANQEADAQERLVAEFGLTKHAIQQMELARMEEQLAQRASLGLTLDEIEQLEKLIDAKKRAVAAGGQLEVLEKNKKATDEATKAQQDMWASIDRTAHDTFVSILDGNKNFAQRMKDTLKNTFFDWLYQMTVKKWIINIQASATGGGSITGVLGSLFGGGKTATGAGGAAQGASSALGAVGGAASWVAIGAAIADGLFKRGFQDPNTVSTFGKVFPGTALSLPADKTLRALGLSSHLAGVLSGSSVTTALFGRKQPEVKAQGITGTLSAGGFSGESFANIFQKGGLFRSSKEWVQTGQLATETDAAFDKAIKGIAESVKGFGGVLGLQTGVIDGYSKAIKLTLTEDEAKNQQLIAEAFGAFGDDLANSLVPGLSALALEGENAAATLQRVAANYTSLDAVLNTISTTFGQVGVESLAARERLIAFAGGMEQLATNVAGFAQNFLTEAERLAPVAEAVTKTLAEMGLSWVDTREEFKQVAMATDKTTEAGAKQFAALMSLQAAFALLYPSTEELNKALLEQQQAAEAAAAATAQAAEEAAAAAAQAAKDLRDSLVEGLRDAVSESLANVTNLIDKQKAQEKAAFDEVLAGINVAVDGANAKIAKLRDLSSVLGSFNATAGQTGQQAAAARQVGAAQIAGALAIAQASGVLPTADSLKFAIGALNQDTSGSFATSEDYQRSQLRAANDINALSRLADDQLSTEERTLKTLQDQKLAAEAAYSAQIKVLDGLLENARQQAESAVSGISIATSQLGTMQGVYSSISELIRVTSALKFAAPPPTPTAPGTTPPGSGTAAPGGTLDQTRAIEQAYQELLGRATDAAGLAFYTEALKSGLTLDQIRQDIINSPEYQAQQAANNAQPAGFAAGAQAGTMSQDTSAALLAELQTLNSQVQAMQTAMDQTAANTGASATSGQQLAQQFDNVTAGGNVLLTESVN